MLEIMSVYHPGVDLTIELFTYAVEELRHFVVYTYYNIEEEPLYVGCSKAFYHAHYFNSQRLDFFDEVCFVGFLFFDNEEDMKDAKRYVIRARHPKHARNRYKQLPILPKFVSLDHLVVLEAQMMRWWETCLGKDNDDIDSENIFLKN